MFSWKKLGRIFDPGAVSGRDWLRSFAQAPATLLFDDYVRVYFSCRPEQEPDGQFRSYSSYADFDRQDPRRLLRIAEEPILPLGGVGKFDEFGVYPVSVIRVGDEVRAYYGGWTRCESVPFNVAIGIARSSDGGKTFSRYGAGPVLGPSLFEPFVISGPKIRFFEGRFHLFYIAGREWILDQGRPEPVYRLRHAVSDDGFNWERKSEDLVPTVLGEDEAQASPDVFYHRGRYHLHFCYRHGSDYRNGERGYRIGYASSEDLVTWTRDDSQVALLPSETGWDSESVSYPHVVGIDGEIYLYYLGNGVGREGFGLAKADLSL